MTVYCSNDECRWNKNYECDRGVINIGIDAECEDFESYLDDEEWQKPFWKRMLDRHTKQIFRVQFTGKEIEIKGLKFFVEYNHDYATATEETTGLSCGAVGELEQRIEKIQDYIQRMNIQPLEEIPIGIYDKKTGKITPMKGGE